MRSYAASIGGNGDNRKIQSNPLPASASSTASMAALNGHSSNGEYRSKPSQSLAPAASISSSSNIQQHHFIRSTPIPSHILTKTPYEVTITLHDGSGNRLTSPSLIYIECSLMRFPTTASNNTGDFHNNDNETKKMFDSSSLNAVETANCLEITDTAKPNASRHGRQVCVIGKDGSSKFHMVVNEVSNINEEFVVEFKVADSFDDFSSNILPAYSKPFSVFKYCLEITSALPDVWYKDQGGKENSLDVDIRLVTTRHHPVLGVSVPLKPSLHYGGGDSVVVIDQNLLKIISDPNPTIDRESGAAHLRLRIEDVSKNHQSRPFVIKIEPDHSRSIGGMPSGPTLHEIGASSTTEVHVRSKHTQASKARESLAKALEPKRPRSTRKTRSKYYDSDESEDGGDDDYFNSTSSSSKRTKPEKLDPVASTSLASSATSTPQSVSITNINNFQEWQAAVSKLTGLINSTSIQLIDYQKQLNSLLDGSGSFLPQAFSAYQQSSNGLLSNRTSSSSSSHPATSPYSDDIYQPDPALSLLSMSSYGSRQNSLSSNKLPFPEIKKVNQERNASLSQALIGLDSLKSALRQNSLFMPDMESFDPNIPRQLSIASQSLLTSPIPLEGRGTSMMLQVEEAVDNNVSCILKRRLDTKIFYGSNEARDASLGPGSNMCFAAFDLSHRFVGFYYRTSPNNLISFLPVSDIPNVSLVKDFEHGCRQDLNDKNSIINIAVGTPFGSGYEVAKGLFH